MSRIAYVNGSYVAQRDAAVNVEDRGYQFADGIYEVIYLHDGRMVDAEAASGFGSERSLRELRLTPLRWAGRRWVHVLAGDGATQPGQQRDRLHPDHPRRIAARSRLSGRTRYRRRSS